MCVKSIDFSCRGGVRILIGDFKKMYCRECGHEIYDGAAFCGNCGTPVDESKELPPPAPILNQWYCVLDGMSPSGPYSDEQINEMVSNKLIQNNTPVWHKGLEDWMEFSQEENQNITMMEFLL